MHKIRFIKLFTLLPLRPIASVLLVYQVFYALAVALAVALLVYVCLSSFLRVPVAFAS
jgi:hypothetical protein